MSFTSSSDINSIRTAINQALSEFVKSENKYLSKIGPELDPVATAIETFLLDSGKRLRPLFAYVGIVGAGAETSVELIKAISSLELIHVCALIHDDVMDASDTRRGAPSIHKYFEKCIRIKTCRLRISIWYCFCHLDWRFSTYLVGSNAS